MAQVKHLEKYLDQIGFSPSRLPSRFVAEAFGRSHARENWYRVTSFNGYTLAWSVQAGFVRDFRFLAPKTIWPEESQLVIDGIPAILYLFAKNPTSHAEAVNRFVRQVVNRSPLRLRLINRKWRATLGVLFDKATSDDPVIVGFLVDVLHGKVVTPLSDYLTDHGGEFGQAVARECQICGKTVEGLLGI
jgi:hypothetical protein